MNEAVFFSGWGFSAERLIPDVSAALSGLHVRAEPPFLHADIINEQIPDNAMEVFSRQAAACGRWLRAPSLLIGWSLGGMLALRVAATHSKKVSGLVLLASAPSFVAREGWPVGKSIAALEAMKHALYANRNKTLNRFVTEVAAGGAKQRARARHLQGALDHAIPNTALALQLDWLARLDLRSDLAHLECPVSLLWGSNDCVASKAAVPFIQRVNRRIKCHEITNAGHALFLGHPKALARAVARHAADSS